MPEDDRDCQTYLEVNTPVLRPMPAEPVALQPALQKEYEGGYFNTDVDLIQKVCVTQTI